METKRFEGKVAIVTGGNAGLGAATAEAYAREGARVVIAARRTDEGEAVAARIRESGGEALFVQTDVTDDASVKAMVAACVARFGGVDVAYNNAGITGPTGKSIVDTDVAEFDQVMSINVRGVWLCMKYQIAEMLKRGGGAIVNCSSTAGIRGGAGNASAYYASKHAVIGLTKNVALEVARQNIRVNAVAPGMVLTDITKAGFANNQAKFDLLFSRIPVGHAGETADIAAAVLWLTSNEAKYVTGETLSVDGGTVV